MTRVDLESGCAVVESDPFDLLALDEALTRLAADEPRKSRLVTLRFFGGLSMVEAANVLSVSLATAERDWMFAKSWLYAELTDEPLSDEPLEPQ